MKKTALLLLFLTPQFVWAWDIDATVEIDRLIVDSSGTGIFMIEMTPSDHGGGSCTHDHRFKWRKSDALGVELYSMALTAIAGDKSIRVFTDGCIGGYPALQRMELIE